MQIFSVDLTGLSLLVERVLSDCEIKHTDQQTEARGPCVTRSLYTKLVQTTYKHI
jgi:hypothetical protein